MSDAKALGHYVKLQTSQIVPAAFPSESFDYYSIPAFDETGGAIPTTGATIESGKFLLSKPAVLVSKLNPRKMRIQVFSGRSQNRAAASTEFMVYEAREGADISIRFLAHFLNGNDFAERLRATATGTTNSHVRARPKETLNWAVSIPPLEEQRRIAEILDTIDETIQATEHVIAKRRALRIGLAADLLKLPTDMVPSEASNRRGQPYRPPRPAPQGSRPCLIPTEPLGHYVTLQTSQIRPAAFPKELFDYYSIPAFDETGGAISTTGATIESGKFLLSEPAVLVSKLNPRKMRVQLFSGMSANRAVASTEFMVYEPRKDGDFSIQFLAHLLHANDFARRLQSTATGTTNSHARSRPEETLRWPVSMPPLEEQRRIAEILDTADGAIQQNEAELSKLRELRAGLGADLLSGRVRTAAA